MLRLAMPRLALQWLAILALAFASGVAAQAQDKKAVTVLAGQKTELAASDKPLTNKSGALQGTVTISQTGGTPARYALDYTAPTTGVQLTEDVVYSDGSDHTVSVTVMPASPATAQGFSPDVYSQAFKALFILFVVATLLESGLAVLFNWRPFVQLFDSRGVQTIISVLVSYIFVSRFDLDVVMKLVNIFSDTKWPSEFASRALTALVLSGGSSGVNNILVALGFRSVKTAADVTGKPLDEHAWISVRLIRKNAVGPVDVLIGPRDTPTVAGTILGTSMPYSLLRYFVRDPGRFPTAGGFNVPLDQAVIVKLRGKDAKGKDIESTPWGPYTPAKGAIVDLEMTL